MSQWIDFTIVIPVEDCFQVVGGFVLCFWKCCHFLFVYVLSGEVYVVVSVVSFFVVCVLE